MKLIISIIILTMVISCSSNQDNQAINAKCKFIGNISRSHTYLSADQRVLYKIRLSCNYGICDKSKLRKEISENLSKGYGNTSGSFLGLDWDLISEEGLARWAAISMTSDILVTNEFINVRPSINFANVFFSNHRVAASHGVCMESQEINISVEKVFEND